MGYLVLARKWRPQTFDQIRGQDHIVRALRNAISSGRIAHAFIFTGTRGVGKTTAARVLAKALNCVEGPTPSPCNKCPACLDIAEGKDPDVLEIDGASNTGVDDVRRLRDVVRYPPVRGKYRVYIIDEVHMLSTAAFNALLKTLEEPPPHVVFIFATTDPHKIPVTILSRCQQYDFKKLANRELMELLREICGSEAIAIDEKSLLAIAREAEGSVRDAQSLLDQVISYAGQTVSYADVQDVLGVVDRDLLLAVAGAVLARDPKELLTRLDEAERFGFDVKRFALDLQDVLRDLAVLKALDDGGDLVELTMEETERARTMIAPLSWEEVHALFDMFSRGVEALRTVSRPLVVLEMTLLKMAKMPPLISLAELGEHAGALAARGGPATGAPKPAAPAAPKPAASSAPEKPAPRPAPAAAAPAPVAADVPVAASPQPAPARGEEAGEETPTDPAAVLERLAEALGPGYGPVLRTHARLVEWNPADGRAELQVDPDQHYGVSLKEEEIRAVLRGLAGRAVALAVTKPAGKETTAQRVRRESDLMRRHRVEFMENPIVRKLIDLGGEVEEMKILES